MMDAFDGVTLRWGGKAYTVPADRQMGLILRVETALRGDDVGDAMYQLFRPGGPNRGALASAYGAALRYAGADVTDDQVFLVLQDRIGNLPQELRFEEMNRRIMQIMAIIAPQQYQEYTRVEDVQRAAAQMGATLVQTLHDVVVAQGWVSGKDFWQMPPQQIWWIIDAHRARLEREADAGSLSPADTEDLHQLLEDAEAAAKAA